MDKSSFRSHCLDRLKSSSRHNKRYKEALLQRSLASLIRRHRAKKVLMYWPLPFEADLRKLLWALPREAEVYLPFMEDVSFKMVPFRLPLTRKKFGIYEAGNTLKNINKIDIAIVPAVGVDAEGRRIGFGKGMYDRFFPRLKKKPVIIFVQLEACVSDAFICDHYDVKADWLVTPHACYSNTGKKDALRNTLRRRDCHHKRGRRLFHF
jgi:5-formyltetrahydrofolate cyclo-ligase